MIFKKENEGNLKRHVFGVKEGMNTHSRENAGYIQREINNPLVWGVNIYSRPMLMAGLEVEPEQNYTVLHKFFCAWEFPSFCKDKEKRQVVQALQLFLSAFGIPMAHRCETQCTFLLSYTLSLLHLYSRRKSTGSRKRLGVGRRVAVREYSMHDQFDFPGNHTRSPKINLSS